MMFSFQGFIQIRPDFGADDRSLQMANLDPAIREENRMMKNCYNEIR